MTSSLIRSAAFIDGQWLGNTREKHAVVNPADQSKVGEVPLLTKEDAVEAIEAAHRAWAPFRARTAKDRAGLLRKWFDLIMASRDDLAVLLTREQGKPLEEAKGEISYAASFIEWFAEEGKRVYGDIVPQVTANTRILVQKQPVGVCVAITPWNFPAAMITRKVAPALAAGCTMVVKPAIETPLTALALAALAEEAGFPPGVLNVITGEAKILGPVLTSHPLVAKLSFTGSTAVGKELMRACADGMKRVTLELGGNAPFLIFDDADVDSAVSGAVASKYRNAGQTCVCANRFIVHERIADEFVAKLVARSSKLRVGPGLDATSDVGPLISEEAVQKVETHLQRSVKLGAKILAGGRRHSLGGTFFEPTVVTGVTSEMPLFQEETFGPVCPVTVFRTEKEGISLANDSPFGLASYAYTRDLSRMFRVSEQLDYGMVGINTGLISNEVAPFGGMKQSGVGREGGKYGIEPYLETKYVCVGI